MEKTIFWLHVFIFFLVSFSHTNSSIKASTNSVSKTQFLSGNQTIISETGKFELGFFSPGNSNNHYIGIWYKNIPKKTIVWVANREAPVTDPSVSKLIISKNGSLVLLNNSTSPVWSTNTKSAATAAVLLDTGNLVLVNGSGSNSYLWQSFNYPTDTWLPGGWLGFDKITKEYQSLTSWKNSNDPSPGLFSESMDPDGSNQYVILWNGSYVYWSSGLWNGEVFLNVPGNKGKTDFNFSFVDNKERKYATYTMLDDSITRCVVDSHGRIRQWFWFNKPQQAWQTIFTEPLGTCDVYSLCGDFGVCDDQSEHTCQCLEGFKPANDEEWKLDDWSSGCVRVSKLQCGGKDGFLEMNNMRLPAKPDNLTVKSSKECESRCMNDCSCNAYTYNSGGCLVWKGEVRNLANIYGGGGDTIFVRLLASDILGESKGKSSSSTAVIIGAVLGSVSAICIAVGLSYICLKKKQNQTLKQVEGSLIQFKYKQLQKMTKNFSEKLGSGGFGTVFKGMMPDSTAIAVKKLEGLRQGEKQFRNEVITLGAVQHVNLVRLFGFCVKESERILVYEFMPKGSLDFHLFSNSSNVLKWSTRYQIALGAARGLTYLHEKCRERIVHCDIKPDNILLDDSFCPKVSDFGMAKLIGRDFSRVLTTMRGTMGYLAPEWISGLPITPKIDVYSYGMMLFEIVSGKRNRVRSEDGSLIFYPSWAARMIVEKEEGMSLVDERLNGEANLEQVERMCKVAIWCVQDDENDRPTMAQVVQALEGLVEVGMPPMPTALKNVASALKLELV